MNEFQFIDIIFLAAVAAFIAFKLRNTLGQDSGGKDLMESRMRRAEQMKDKVIPLPGMDAPPPLTESNAAEDLMLLAEIEDPDISKTLIEIKKQDPMFSLGEFVEGAKTAFEWVFNAFAKKDRKVLKSLLAKDVYESFDRALKDMESEQRYQESTLVAIESSNIIRTELKKNIARLTVKFVSEQVTLMRGKDGEIVEGNPSQVDTVEDEWVFERNLKSGNPNWLIVAT